MLGHTPKFSLKDKFWYSPCYRYFLDIGYCIAEIWWKFDFCVVNLCNITQFYTLLIWKKNVMNLFFFFWKILEIFLEIYNMAFFAFTFWQCVMGDRVLICTWKNIRSLKFISFANVFSRYNNTICIENTLP